MPPLRRRDALIGLGLWVIARKRPRYLLHVKSYTLLIIKIIKITET